MNIIASLLLWTVAILSVYFAVFWFLVFLDGGSKEHRRKKLDTCPFVTIVVPAYNECVREDTGEIRGVVDSTIHHVMNLEYPQDRYEVIVVNDGSTDNTHEVISKAVAQYHDRNIRYINKEKNAGKHEAMNDAIALAKGEFLVSLDGDSILKPHVLKELLTYFVEDDIACVCPNMQVLKPKTILERIQWYEYVLNMFYKKLMSHIDCVHVAPGPFSVYRIDAIRHIGGFRSAHKTEDLEITYRLQQAKYRIVQALDVKVATKAPDTWRAFFRQRKRWFRGALLNTFDYRKLLFSKEHGDFGFIQLPFVLASPVMAVVMISIFLYYSLKNYFKMFKEWYVINFDFMHYLRSLTLNFNILDLDFVSLVTFIFIFSITCYVLYKAFVACKEKLLDQGKISLGLFLFFYYLLVSSAWVMVVYDLATRRKGKW
ncbi:glycosyltransferase [Candidatus Woesearchaeota archaeon]|nr:glycosyltransferase [Candidatus Woesearchaeota archaeon]